jgi:hypothetical protein
MKLKKLKIPLWQNLVYLALVVFVPLLIVYLEACHTGKGWFIASMTFFILGLVAISVINALVIKPWRVKCIAKMAQLETNYSTGVGKELETQALWKQTGFRLFLWDAGSLLFTALAVTVAIEAIATKLMAIRGAILIMLLSVILGLLFKGACYLVQPKQEPVAPTSTPQP